MPDPTPTDLPPLERATKVLYEARTAHRYNGRAGCTCGQQDRSWYEGDCSFAEHVDHAIIAALTAAGIHLVTEGQAVLQERVVEMEQCGWVGSKSGMSTDHVFETDSPIYRPKQHTDGEEGQVG